MNSLYLFYVGTIKIQKKINIYRKLLKSDKHFTKEDYRYFGGRIYELRLLRKQIAEDQAIRLLNKLRKTK